MGRLSFKGSGDSKSKVFRRIKIAYVLGYALLSLIALRLWYLQCLNGSHYRNLSENNRTRTLVTQAPRGSIYDREGRLLVGNRPAFDVALMLEDTPSLGDSLAALSSLLEVPAEQLKARIEDKRARPFEPQVVVRDVDRQDLAKVKANQYRLPGLFVSATPTRTYPFESLAVQLFGYVREISKGELAKLAGRYRRGDMVGKSGLERSNEADIKGQNGFIQVEVDARGNRKQELGLEDNLQGSDLYLTLDLDLQLAAENALKDRRGAVVAVDPRNGDILAMASSPSYNGNVFSGEMALEAWNAINRDPDKPMLNRAIGSAYPPGSTFKLLMAVAGLAEGIISEKTKKDCPGYVKFGRRRYHCHKRSGHGKVDLRTAITVSCNAYFYRLGVELGIERLEKYSKLFGLGSSPGLGIGAESPGIVPSKSWKLKRYGERWYPGDTIPVTIGQGYLSVTPLQMAMAMASLGNGGTLYQPRLIRKVGSSETTDSPVIVRDVMGVPKEHFKAVRSMAADVVNAKKGTGSYARLDGVIVGGKTGTAQVSSLGKEALGERFKDHAWFVSFAPEVEPTIAMAIIVENAGHGGVEAAPISKSVMEVHFKKLGMLKEPEENKTEQDEAIEGEESEGAST